MTDRLQELLRQRTSIQTHLDWLDREIAREKSSHPGPGNTATDPVAQTAVPQAHSAPLQPVKLQPDASTDDIFAQYRQDQGSLRSDVRKGCLLYFFGAFALLGLAITAFYFLNKLLKSGAP